MLDCFYPEGIRINSAAEISASQQATIYHCQKACQAASNQHCEAFAWSMTLNETDVGNENNCLLYNNTHISFNHAYNWMLGPAFCSGSFVDSEGIIMVSMMSNRLPPFLLQIAIAFVIVADGCYKNYIYGFRFGNDSLPLKMGGGETLIVSSPRACQRHCQNFNTCHAFTVDMEDKSELTCSSCCCCCCCCYCCLA